MIRSVEESVTVCLHLDVASYTLVLYACCDDFCVLDLIFYRLSTNRDCICRSFQCRAPKQILQCRLHGAGAQTCSREGISNLMSNKVLKQIAVSTDSHYTSMMANHKVLLLTLQLNRFRQPPRLQCFQQLLSTDFDKCALYIMYTAIVRFD